MLEGGPPIHVLGVPLNCVDYLQAVERAKTLAGEARPGSVAACNTHLLVTARRDPKFGDILRSFDLNLPDGMPLIWVLKKRRQKLPERVHGPHFMREMLKHTPRPWRHFFFGGMVECLEQLKAAATALQPEIEIVGMLTPPARAWTEEEEREFARQINAAAPDFIWVALDGPRQETWIAENRHRYKRGVFLAVGDAFELLIGRHEPSPVWMEKAGLTWFDRLIQDPKRTWLRSLRDNTKFAWYLVRDLLAPTRLKVKREKTEGLRVAFLGSRGTPARYAGFETVVEELGARLAARGDEVIVYNRTMHFPDRPPSHRGMSIIYIPSVPARSLETFVHTFVSALHAMSQHYDIIYLCGVGNAVLAWLLRRSGARVVINVDGIDFRRAKWSGFARNWLRWSERWAVALADRVIADNRAVVEHYERNYQFTPIHLSYGTITNPPPIRNGELLKWELRPRHYVLFVGRLSPENEAEMLIRSFVDSNVKLPLVIVGAPGYEHSYYRRLRALADERVIFTGGVYGGGYRELSQNCLFFVLPAAIEATRLVLLDQMGMGNAVVFQESDATREVIGEAGLAFRRDVSRDDLREKLEYLAAHPERCTELGQQAMDRADKVFSWERVTDQYTKIFAEITERLEKEETAHSTPP